MKRFLVLLAACGSPEPKKLPSAAILPALQARAPATACGIDVAVDESGMIAARYRYTFDDFGRLSHAHGTLVGSPRTESIDYSWDNLDHMVHMTQRTWDNSPFEIVAQYNTLGDLLDYNRIGFNDARFVFSALTAEGLPTRETITQAGSTVTYTLAYDTLNRIAKVTPDGNWAPTIYTYDDDGKTLSIVTGNYHGLIVYDDQNRELSESWDGPDSIATADQYTYEGDRLMSVTARSGNEQAPHELRVVEIDTYRYHCGP